jgi:hypothetical protein
MPTNRTRRARAPHPDALSTAALEAWQRGDYHALCRVLATPPWQPSPWPLELTALGCDQGPCPRDAGPLWRAGWRRAQELQRALLEAAGEPGRMDRHGAPLGPTEGG